MDKVSDMGKTSGTGADKKLILVSILVFLTLGGSFALIYVNLKADLTSLKNNNANLSSQIEQLR